MLHCGDGVLGVMRGVGFAPDIAFSLNATLPRRSSSQSRLFTVDVETGVLRVLFNEAAS